MTTLHGINIANTVSNIYIYIYTGPLRFFPRGYIVKGRGKILTHLASTLSERTLNAPPGPLRFFPRGYSVKGQGKNPNSTVAPSTNRVRSTLSLTVYRLNFSPRATVRRDGGKILAHLASAASLQTFLASPTPFLKSTR